MDTTLRQRQESGINLSAQVIECDSRERQGGAMATKQQRPPIWIGHKFRRVSDVRKSADFFRKLGLRRLMANSNLAILELRGGTHLLLFRDLPKNSWVQNDSFDFMVEDIKRAHSAARLNKLKVSPLKRQPFHTYFEVVDPDGNRWEINSDHTEGRSV
jgi:catechol 2,3-dioxygenase-like lactoylglutathione lyase family enzyme